jgi:membrane fusion protein, copper/silver efflux system
MTRNEKKLFVYGAAGGIVLAVLAVVLAAHWPRLRAVDGAVAPAIAPNSAAAPVDTSGPQSGATIQLTPDEITAAGVQVAAVRTERLKTDIEAFGRVEQPEAQLAIISARIGGRIDRLYVQFTGEKVRRGQAVAELYSPEVATATEEYHLAVENRSHLSRSDDADARLQADALVTASQRKLELWGVHDTKPAAASGIPHVTLYANASGTVVERKATQGQYVNAGEALFTVADLSQVWIKAEVYEAQLPQVRPGQVVEIYSEALPNQILRGRVDFIEPAANPQTRTVPVHVHVANPGMRLVPGMFVRANLLSSAARDSLVVPRSAVIDTGTRKIVYVAKNDGVYEAREVELGTPSEDFFPVSSGVKMGDKVVVNGNFLIDSQTRLTASAGGQFGGAEQFADKGHDSQTQAGAVSAVPAAKLSLSIVPDPPNGGAENMFHAELRDAGGKPIPGAQVTVTLIMPAMPSMSMPEMRNSFDLPETGGMYMGKGNILSGGSWNVVATARKDGKTLATFHTHINAK